MNTVTYCDNGHLWDKEAGKPCYGCVEDEHEAVLDLIEEIEGELHHGHNTRALDKLRLLREMLTD